MEKKNGKIGFYKDGYTDLRGRFDYCGVSQDENSLKDIKRFGIYVKTIDKGNF